MGHDERLKMLLGDHVKSAAAAVGVVFGSVIAAAYVAMVWGLSNGLIFAVGIAHVAASTLLFCWCLGKSLKVWSFLGGFFASGVAVLYYLILFLALVREQG